MELKFKWDCSYFSFCLSPLPVTGHLWAESGSVCLLPPISVHISWSVCRSAGRLWSIINMGIQWISMLLPWHMKFPIQICPTPAWPQKFIKWRCDLLIQNRPTSYFHVAKLLCLTCSSFSVCLTWGHWDWFAAIEKPVEAVHWTMKYWILIASAFTVSL